MQGISKHSQQMKEERKFETVELECDAKLREVKAAILGSTPESARAGGKPNKSMPRGLSDGTLALHVAPDVKREQEKLWKAAKKSKKNQVDHYTEDDVSD